MHVVVFVTDFADQAVVLPVAAWITAGMLLARWRRGALVWALTIAGVLGIMLILKLIFTACGSLLPFDHIRSPSGHTAAAEAVYGGIAALLLRREHGFATALATGAAFALTIGATRLLLGVHTLGEVIAGTVVGLAGLVALLRLIGPLPPTLRWGRLVGAALVLITLFHGVHLGAEPLIRRFAFSDFWPLSACLR